MSEIIEKQVENEDSNENSNEEKKKQTNKLVSLIKKLPFEIYIALLFFILTALFMLTPIYRQLELTSYDMRFQLKKKVKQTKKVTIVEIDDAAIKNIAKWVWRRNLHAQGVKIMQELGARQILFDIEFTEQSARAVTKQDRKNFPIVVRSKLDSLKNEIGSLKRSVLKGDLRDLSLKLGTFQNSIEKRKKDILQTITSLGQDDDLIFALAMKQFGKVIIPIRGWRDTTKEKTEPVTLEYVYNNYGIKSLWKKSFKKISKFTRIDVPKNPLHRAPYRLGFTNSDSDEDGVRRRILLFSRYRKMLFPQLAVASLFDILGIAPKDIAINPGSSVVLRNALLPGEKKRRNIKIPTDSKGMMMINWTGDWSRSFSRISFYNLFDYWKSKENYLKVLSDLDNNIFNGQGNIALKLKMFQELAGLEKAGKLLTVEQKTEKLALESFITNIGGQEIDA
ncbi:MAG: CHASE2 domain-containing protein, partial [Spirochaetes bacterium]|nr:CHASE2 domain-containing protein [Spirochaetota bacterium]